MRYEIKIGSAENGFIYQQPRTAFKTESEDEAISEFEKFKAHGMSPTLHREDGAIYATDKTWLTQQ